LCRRHPSPDRNHLTEPPKGTAMGDHRATIKIHFIMHDVDAKQEWWINWSPGESIPAVDPRVTEWLAKQAQNALDGYHNAESERRTREIEEKERAEYQRLKAKYNP
jgi:hypothetical protein